MRYGLNFIRSRLSRRIIALFVICALFPVALLSGISLWIVDGQLREQAHEELRNATHDEGMSVYERLTFVEADLKLAAVDPNVLAGRVVRAADISAGLGRRTEGLEIVSRNGARKLLFGDVTPQVDLTPEQLEYLQSGKSMVLTRRCTQATQCIFMARQVDPTTPARGILLAKVSPSYLLASEGIRESENICILDDQNAPIVCSGDTTPFFPSSVFRAVSGRFQSKQHGEAYESAYWQLFLKPNFRTGHWTIVASKSRGSVLAPFAHFKKVFLLVVLLALWVVLLLSLVQIRLNLVPLGELLQATRRISNGEFGSRVKIESRDEFEDLAESFNSMAGQIERQFNSLKAKNAIDRAILSSWDMEQIVDSLLAHLRSVLPYMLGCVSLIDRHSEGRIRSYLSSNGCTAEKDTRNAHFPDQELNELLAHPEGYTASLKDPCPQFLLPLASRGTKFFLVAPVMVRGELAAIISLGSDLGSPWTGEDILQARQIADEAGVALSNARLLADLQDLNLGILTALARAIDAKSHWTAGHSERVTEVALKIAKEMELSPKDLDILRRGGLLHDIGKIGIPSELLDKPGKLTAEEMALVREHVEIGKRILEPIQGFAECMPVVLQHHEWVDGSGYPYGLRGEQISIHARIFAVADCYDALVSERPYRRGLQRDRVLEILRKGVGKQFDASVMEAFSRVVANPQEQNDEAAPEQLPAVQS
jgi:putative nucleotidyltransferase with HDIG domain